MDKICPGQEALENLELLVYLVYPVGLDSLGNLKMMVAMGTQDKTVEPGKMAVELVLDKTVELGKTVVRKVLDTRAERGKTAVGLVLDKMAEDSLLVRWVSDKMGCPVNLEFLVVPVILDFLVDLDFLGMKSLVLQLDN